MKEKIGSLTKSQDDIGTLGCDAIDIEHIQSITGK